MNYTIPQINMVPNAGRPCQNFRKIWNILLNQTGTCTGCIGLGLGTLSLTSTGHAQFDCIIILIDKETYLFTLCLSRVVRQGHKNKKIIEKARSKEHSLKYK